MTWIKLDDSFPDHPKIVGLSDSAFRCWVQGLCYSRRYLTDGFVNAAALVRGIGTRKAAAELVKAGLWEWAEGGWQIHDYAEHQQLKEDVLERQAERSKTGTRGNHERWHKGRSQTDPSCRYCIADPIATATEEGSLTRSLIIAEVEVEREIDKGIGQNTWSSSMTDLDAGDELFDQFWTAYPAKKQKGAARKAWAKARRRENPLVIIDGARRYAVDLKVLEGIVRNPATWLNGDGWHDEPTPAPPVRTMAGAAKQLHARFDLTDNSFLALPTPKENQ